MGEEEDCRGGPFVISIVSWTGMAIRVRAEVD